MRLFPSFRVEEGRSGGLDGLRVDCMLREFELRRQLSDIVANWRLFR